MSDFLDASVHYLVQSTQFSHAAVAEAIETLRAYPDNEAPMFTPWTDEQLAERLPVLAAMAATRGRPLQSVAQSVRRAVGITWDAPAAPAEEEH